MRKYYRSTREKQLTGVIGGLSERFGIDVSILRIVTVVSGFFTSGITWLIYLIAAIVMPTDKQLDER